jgi:hypothetical protein
MVAFPYEGKLCGREELTEKFSLTYKISVAITKYM